MSIKSEIIERLARNDIPFISVKVDKEGDLNGEAAYEVKIDSAVGGQSYVREWKFAKRNNMSEHHIADVVLSYFMKGKNK